MLAFGRLIERGGAQERSNLVRRHLETRSWLPLLSIPDVHLAPKHADLFRRHEAGMVVLVSCERQSVTLDGVRDEARRSIVCCAPKRTQHGFQIVAGEIRHQAMQRSVV